MDLNGLGHSISTNQVSGHQAKWYIAIPDTIQTQNNRTIQSFCWVYRSISPKSGLDPNVNLVLAMPEKISLMLVFGWHEIFLERKAGQVKSLLCQIGLLWEDWHFGQFSLNREHYGHHLWEGQDLGSTSSPASDKIVHKAGAKSMKIFTRLIWSHLKVS